MLLIDYVPDFTKVDSNS